MKKISLVVFLSVFYFASFAFAEGMSDHQHGMAGNAQATDMEMTKVYVCPMDQYTSDKPGRCPSCGMNLEEKEMLPPGAKAAVERSKKAQVNDNGSHGSHSH